MNRKPSPLRLLLLMGVCLTIAWAVRRTVETSRVEFSVEVEGQPAPQAEVSVGGNPVSSGHGLWPGWRSVEVTGDRLEPLHGRRWVWPGRTDWGVFSTRYQRSRVELTVIPRPLRMKLGEGKEAAEVVQSSTLTAHPIVGTYVLQAFFPTFTNLSVVTVTAGQALTLTTRVEVGWVWPTAEPTDATTELRQGEQVLLTGKAGEVLGPVPVGDYQVMFQRKKERIPIPVKVIAEATNSMTYRFVYGKLDFDTVPPGATVWVEGQKAGTAPVTLEEITPGVYHVRFEHPDLVAQEREVTVIGDHVERIDVRLHQREAARLWDRAQRSAQAGDLAAALQDAVEILRVEPDWLEVKEKERTWELAYALDRAKSALERGSLADATGALVTAVKLDPENSTAKQLQSRLVALRAQQSEAQRNEAFTQNLERARREMAADHYVEALAAVEEALTLRPDDVSARQLKGTVLAAQAKAEAAKRERVVRTRFVAVKGTLVDSQLFADAEWRLTATAETMKAALLRTIQQPRNQWKLAQHQETPDGVSHAVLEVRSIIVPRKDGLVCWGPTTEGQVLVLVAFLEHAIGNEVSPVPVHPAFWYPQEPQRATMRRQDFLNRFEQALKLELERPQP